jgi:anaerobic ribonucleoside-triphosphate reductase
MPHADELITCKNCGEFYCAVCKECCPKCGIEDIVDAQRKKLREKRRKILKQKEG